MAEAILLADPLFAKEEFKTNFCRNCKCITERYISGRCKPCAKLQARSWQVKNAGKEKLRKADWQARHFEGEKARKSDWQSQNPLKVRASSAAYKAKNPERARQFVADWQKANRDVVKIHVNNRRAKIREDGGRLSIDIIQRLLAAQNGKCPCCKAPLGNDFHIDHIVPISLGGANVDSNIQLLRTTCNLKKSNKDPIVFMQSKGFLL